MEWRRRVGRFSLVIGHTLTLTRAKAECEICCECSPFIFIELKCFFDISGGPATCSAFMFVRHTFFSSIAPSEHDMMGIIKIQLRLPKMGCTHKNQFTHYWSEGFRNIKKYVMKIVVIVQRRMSMTEEEGGQCWGTSNIFGQSILLCNFFFSILMNDNLMSVWCV